MMERKISSEGSRRGHSPPILLLFGVIMALMEQFKRLKVVDTVFVAKMLESAES